MEFLPASSRPTLGPAGPTATLGGIVMVVAAVRAGGGLMHLRPLWSGNDCLASAAPCDAHPARRGLPHAAACAHRAVRAAARFGWRLLLAPHGSDVVAIRTALWPACPPPPPAGRGLAPPRRLGGALFCYSSWLRPLVLRGVTSWCLVETARRRLLKPGARPSSHALSASSPLFRSARPLTRSRGSRRRHD
jgi:hypothetical protein